MFYLILICFIVLLIVGLSYWVKHTMEKYSEPADRYSFTGAQLARDLLDRQVATCRRGGKRIGRPL